MATVRALDEDLASYPDEFAYEYGVTDVEDLQVGVEGAYGVFGAVTTVRDTVELGE